MRAAPGGGVEGFGERGGAIYGFGCSILD